jgi:hypothetical protein
LLLIFVIFFFLKKKKKKKRDAVKEEAPQPVVERVGRKVNILLILKKVAQAVTFLQLHQSAL